MKPRVFLVCLAALLAPADIAAQETAAGSGSPPQRIDILIDTTPEGESFEDCSPEQEDAAAISGTIIVCGKRTGSENRLYSKEEAERRYARETMNQGIIAAPDVAGAGIFRGPATVSGLCVIPPCPPPPAYMIDFSALPDAPPGSDADRIARGLPPSGGELEPPAATEMEPIEETVSPPGSASPAEGPSD